MEEAFVSYLLAGVDLGGIIAGRIDWGIRPQAQNTPAVVLHAISSVPVYSDEGFADLTSARIQADCWAKTYAQAKDAARKLHDRLLAGGSAKFVHGGIEFQFVFKDDEQDSFERGAAAEDLYRVRLDFTLMYKGE